jgi:hypothetical protein
MRNLADAGFYLYQAYEEMEGSRWTSKPSFQQQSYVHGIKWELDPDQRRKRRIHPIIVGDTVACTYLTEEASRRGIHRNVLATLLLRAIAQDKLYDALLLTGECSDSLSTNSTKAPASHPVSSKNKV